MTKELFLQNLADILVVDPRQLQPETPLKNFKGWDSMGQMAVLTLVDTDVGVTVPLNWLSECDTVGKLLTLVEPKLQQ
jgi:acyl carrier protein